tara:strand:- start:52 stop:780 length:729 start_codon:yes stop_codon:yes gene_type:complete
MSILSTQALGGQISNPGRTYSSSQNPFPISKQHENENFNDFHGFRYAADAESRDAFGTTITFTGPVTDEALFQSLTEEATTYGNPGQFTRLADDQSTVLTQMAQFVDDGQNSDGDTLSDSYANQRMKHSFSTGNGTRGDRLRGQFDHGDGWGISLNIKGRFDRADPYDFAAGFDPNNAVIPRPEGGSDSGASNDTAEAAADAGTVDAAVAQENGGHPMETTVAVASGSAGLNDESRAALDGG